MSNTYDDFQEIRNFRKFIAQKNIYLRQHNSSHSSYYNLISGFKNRLLCKNCFDIEINAHFYVTKCIANNIIDYLLIVILLLFFYCCITKKQ